VVYEFTSPLAIPTRFRLLSLELRFAGQNPMTLLRYSQFVLCIALTTGAYAQEHATPLPDAPDTQKLVAGVARNTKPSLDGW
jgi:hypothetical protein